MNLSSIASFFSSQQTSGISKVSAPKGAGENTAGTTSQDSLGPAYQIDLSPQAQAMMANGGSVVQALMTDGVTGTGSGYVNYNGTFKAGLFSVADANGDKVVTRDELSQQAVAGGASKEDADAMFKVNDENHDGQVTAQEFSETMATPTDRNTFGGQLSKMLDTDGDGTISQAEIDRMLEKSGQSRETIDGVNAQLGLNGTGGIGEQDLVARLKGASSAAT